MSKSSFTPGPWTSAAEYQQLDLGESIEVFANVPIAMVMNFDDFPCIEEEKAEDFDIEAQANARLIAAAPALYAAALIALDLTVPDDEAHKALRAAIALVGD